MAACSDVDDTYVVVRSLPFQRTTDVETKFVPLRFKVKAGSLACLVSGEMVLSVGAGLFTVTVCAFEVPPPGVGLKTVTENVPAVAASVAGMAAVTCVGDTYVVVRFAPSQR